jgi:hypothetical protein
MNGTGQYRVGGNPPALSDLGRYDVNRSGQVEAIWNPLYHRQTYAQAGQLLLTFFQTPLGAAATPTLASTNMKSAGQLPRPQEFLCTGIQVHLRSPAAVGRQAANVTTVTTNWNNLEAALESLSWLDFTIGSKSYVQDGPLSKFPPQFGLGGVGATSIFAAAAQTAVIDYAKGAGRYYAISPVRIPANQNFSVTLNWTAVQAIAADSLCSVILDGYLYRLSQ